MCYALWLTIFRFPPLFGKYHTPIFIECNNRIATRITFELGDRIKRIINVGDTQIKKKLRFLSIRYQKTYGFEALFIDKFLFVWEIQKHADSFSVRPVDECV